MLNRTAIIIGGMLILGIIVIITVTGIFRGSPGHPTVTGDENRSLPGLIQRAAVVPLDSASIPAGSTLTIGTSKGPVTVNNFYKIAIGVDAGTILLVEDPAYEITYDSSVSSFSIFLKGGGTAMAQASAENEFLRILGIPQAQACLLNVTVSTSSLGGNPPGFCNGTML